MATNFTDKIASIEEQIKQLENRKKELAQKERNQARRERTHRICDRGGLIESILPETIALTKEQFQEFIRKTLLTSIARRELEDIRARKGAEPDGTMPKREKDNGILPAGNTAMDLSKAGVNAMDGASGNAETTG